MVIETGDLPDGMRSIWAGDDLTLVVSDRLDPESQWDTLFEVLGRVREQRRTARAEARQAASPVEDLEIRVVPGELTGPMLPGERIVLSDLPDQFGDL